MKNSHKCNFLGDGGSGKSTIKKRHQRDGPFDGVCCNVLGVRMLELIFVAFFAVFFLDYVFLRGDEGKLFL